MTQALIYLFICAIIVTDIALLKSEKHNTYSRFIARHADAHQGVRLFVTIAMGVLAGHWLWPVHIC